MNTEHIGGGEAGRTFPAYIYRSVARIRPGLWCWACWANRKCQGDPVNYGTESSKEAAMIAAEQDIRHSYPKSSVFEGKPWKAHWHYHEEVRQPATITYSRCSAGPDKWFWCYWRYEEWLEGKRAFATGYASSAAEAEAQAISSCGQHFPDQVCDQTNAHAAAAFRRRLVAEQKAAQTSNGRGSQVQEFVYSDYWDGDCSFKHRIIKKTTKRVFIDSEIWTDSRRVYGDWRDYAWSKSYSLDREKLERDGSVWSRAAREFFHLLPLGERCRRHEVATLDEVKCQWRQRLFDAHPDQGGNADEFKRVYAEYERALALR